MSVIESRFRREHYPYLEEHKDNYINETAVNLTDYVTMVEIIRNFKGSIAEINLVFNDETKVNLLTQVDKEVFNR